MNLSCLCCAARDYCILFEIGKHCNLEEFEPSNEFLMFVNDLTEPLTELPIDEATLTDGSSAEAEI